MLDLEKDVNLIEKSKHYRLMEAEYSSDRWVHFGLSTLYVFFFILLFVTETKIIEISDNVAMLFMVVCTVASLFFAPILTARIRKAKRIEAILREATDEMQQQLEKKTLELESYKTNLDMLLQDATLTAEMFDEIVKENEKFRELRGHTRAMIGRINYFQKKRSQSDGQYPAKNDSAS